MKRQPFYILLLKGIGYIVLGNFLCFFMTMALTMFTSKSDNPGFVILMNIIAMICSALIFHMLVFTVAWKDGTRERSLVKNKRVDGPLPRRWIFLGVILFLIAAAPTIVLLFNKLFFPEADTFYVYRFISGSAYPFIQTFVPMPELADKAWVETTYRQIDDMSPLFPALMLIFYAIIPAVTQLGWYVGYNDKFNKDNIMYK